MWLCLHLFFVVCIRIFTQFWSISFKMNFVDINKNLDKAHISLVECYRVVDNGTVYQCVFCYGPKTGGKIGKNLPDQVKRHLTTCPQFQVFVDSGQNWASLSKRPFFQRKLSMPIFSDNQPKLIEFAKPAYFSIDENARLLIDENRPLQPLGTIT